MESNLLVEAFRECREDLLADPLLFGTELLGWDYTDPADFLIECSEAMVANENYLMLVPRGHSKTTLSDTVGGTWEICRNPNIRILLGHGNLDKAEALLGSITANFKPGSKVLKYFPEHTPKGREEDPRKREWTTPARERVFQEPTIRAGAPSSMQEGPHYDLIKVTDLVNRTNTPPPLGVGSIETMRQVESFIQSLAPLRDATNPESRIQIDGTRWFSQDAYSEVLKWSNFRHIIRTIERKPDGSFIPIWSKIPAEMLAEMHSMMSSALWDSNMRQSPGEGSLHMRFREEMIRDFDHDEKNEVPMDIAITVDMADSLKPDACDTSIQVTGVATDGGLYCLADVSGIFHPRVFLDHLIDLTKTWSPRYVGLEAPAYKNFLQHAVWQEGIEQGVFLPLVALDPGNRSKEARASGLLNYVDRYGIYLRPGMDDMRQAIIDFPLGKKRDRIDALAYRTPDILRARKKGRKVQKERGKIVSIYDRGDTLAQMMDDPRYRHSVEASFRSQGRFRRA